MRNGPAGMTVAFVALAANSFGFEDFGQERELVDPELRNIQRQRRNRGQQVNENRECEGDYSQDYEWPVSGSVGDYCPPDQLEYAKDSKEKPNNPCCLTETSPALESRRVR